MCYLRCRIHIQSGVVCNHPPKEGNINRRLLIEYILKTIFFLLTELVLCAHTSEIQNCLCQCVCLCRADKEQCLVGFLLVGTVLCILCLFGVALLLFSL